MHSYFVMFFLLYDTQFENPQQSCVIHVAPRLRDCQHCICRPASFVAEIHLLLCPSKDCVHSDGSE